MSIDGCNTKSFWKGRLGVAHPCSDIDKIVTGGRIKGILHNFGVHLRPMEDGLQPFKGKDLKAGASVSRTGGLED